MSLEQDILRQVANASDEAALEGLRVATLGKKGSISEQMKSLGAMGPEERKTAGAALNVLKESDGSDCGAQSRAARRQLERRLASEKIDVPCLPATSRAARFIPSPRCGKKWCRFSVISVCRGRRPHIEDDFHNFPALTFHQSIRRGKSMTPSISARSQTAAAWFCARIPRLCRSAPC